MDENYISQERAIERMYKVTEECGTESIFIDRIIDELENLPSSPHICIHPLWIPVSERLPEEKTYVLISCGGNVHVARIAMGIDEQMRDAMKRGELSDPLIPSWIASTGYTWVKRSMLYSGCDVHGNNLVPYCWYSNYGPGKWFGQEVSHWMPLPEPPKEV